MRLRTTTRILALYGVSLAWLAAGGASAEARSPYVVPGIGPSDWAPAPYRPSAVRGHRPARAYRHVSYAVADAPAGAGPFDEGYRPAAYSAVDVYAPRPPRAYGYVFPPSVEPPYGVTRYDIGW